MSNTAGSANFASRTSAAVANVSIASSGNNTVIAAVAGTTIRIVKIALGVASGSSVTAVLQSGSSTSLGTYYLGSMVLDMENNPLTLAAGQAFVINLSGATQTYGQVWYQQD